jgi:hypothetical protein
VKETRPTSSLNSTTKVVKAKVHKKKTPYQSNEHEVFVDISLSILDRLQKNDLGSLKEMN